MLDVSAVNQYQPVQNGANLSSGRVAPFRDGSVVLPAQASGQHSWSPPDVEFPEEEQEYFAGTVHGELASSPSQGKKSHIAMAQEPSPFERLAVDLQRFREHMEALAVRYGIPPKALEFDIYDELGLLYVRIRDKRTDEIIATRPAEEFLELRSRLKRMVGVFLEEIA